MSTFRNLLIWQKSMDLVTKIYSSTQQFPKEELFGLTSQIRRSAISIPSNIAEGYGRDSNKIYEDSREIERMLTSFIKKIKERD